MKIAVLSENNSGERRVSASPDTVKAYVKKGLAVAVQAGAGLGPIFPMTHLWPPGPAS